MQITKVSLPAGQAQNYNIYIGSRLLPKIAECVEIKKYSKIAVVVDRALVDQPWFADFASTAGVLSKDQDNLIVINGSESEKNVASVEKLWVQFQRLALDRKSLIVNVGGGALCDMSGFAAATYMRGISFVHVPTTLLSQVDASIGGKVGVNCSEVKNLVGSFAQPRAVIVDIDTLKTLSPRELASGFAEVIKHGLIQSKDYFEMVKGRASSAENESFLIDVVSGSSQIKASVVAADETESGVRKILNFGHTVGHALESLSHRNPVPLLHGEAISLGMVAESKLSQLLGYLQLKDVKEIEDTLVSYSLPVRLDFECSNQDVMSKVRSDKKNVASAIKWSLLSRIGCALYDITADDEKILQAVDYLRHE